MIFLIYTACPYFIRRPFGRKMYKIQATVISIIAYLYAEFNNFLLSGGIGAFDNLYYKLKSAIFY